MRKTKIVCTIGPASESEEMLEKLINAGMNVARLNFSHGNHEEHAARIETIRKVSKRIGKVVGIFKEPCAYDYQNRCKSKQSIFFYDFYCGFRHIHN